MEHKSVKNIAGDQCGDQWGEQRGEQRGEQCGNLDKKCSNIKQ